MKIMRANIFMLLVCTIGYTRSDSDYLADSDGAGSDGADSNGADSADPMPASGEKDFSQYPPGKACKKGDYFWHDCNMCFCYENGFQGCTLIGCSQEAKQVQTLKGTVKSAAYKKLQAKATNCVPGETVKSGNCECSCPIPSVIVCPPECLS